jgi:hypothetical protein
MFSFFAGKKQVHFADTSITLNSKQSLLKKETGFGQSYWTPKLFIIVNSSFF